MKKSIRLLSLLLSILLCLSLLSVSVLAEDSGTIEAEDGGTIAYAWEYAPEEEFLDTNTLDDTSVSTASTDKKPSNKTQIDLVTDYKLANIRFISKVEDFLITVYLVDSSESRIPVEMEADGSFNLLPGAYQYEAYGLDCAVFQSGELYVVNNNSKQVIRIDFEEEISKLNANSLPNKSTALLNEATIYSYLTKNMGLNCAAACGVLANIQKESAFNPNLYGDSGTSYGICQWHNSTNAKRFTALKEYCAANGYDYTSLAGQLHYLDHELQSFQDGSVLHKLRSVPDTADGAYEAGYCWCFNYEAPVDYRYVSILRGNCAKDSFWPAYSDSCIVTFSAKSENSSMVSKMVPKNSQLGFSPVPARNGFVFDGWYTSATGGTRMNYYSTVNSSLTLYAHWVTASTITPKNTLIFDGRKYELYDNPMSWTDAKAMCELLGGHLVTITDDSEQAAIADFIAKGRSGRYYIGYTDEKKKGSWKWVTGETGDYSNWDTQGSEGTDGTYRYCAMIVDIEKASSEQNGKWVKALNACTEINDQHISNCGFICEYDAYEINSPA